ncbi:hypothetical protein U4I37_20040 [Stenotrophomonas maltophilia]|uniref:hypothetical protein n=1 Tax=Stenotrophomonas maltophilia TaxID=40324 RepID=UPI0015F2426E|nr:hypothetical protein [Stenotrophomonas maltophilia]MDZ5788533.1 hypothetical protein [Stenotrophomonas maltophilia]QDY47281.1 hypothetical protein DUW70_01370 [Stenotrophomonas maltophilia]HEL5345901.1 hypothetical protein [Stenotrophomonas maltophilia]
MYLEVSSAGGVNPATQQETYTVILSSGDEMFLVPATSPEEAARSAVASWATRYGEVVEAVRVCRTGEGTPQ